MGWGVAMTQPNCEVRADEHLTRQGFQTYLPRFKSTTALRGRKIVQSKILFRNYIFVNIADRWKSIFGTRGVSTLLMNGDKPSTVSDELIRRLKSQEQNGLIILPAGKRFHRGQSVKVLSGQFQGLLGLYDGMSASDREIVLLRMFGRLTRVQIAASDLTAH